MVGNGVSVGLLVALGDGVEDSEGVLLGGWLFSAGVKLGSNSSVIIGEMG